MRRLFLGLILLSFLGCSTKNKTVKPRLFVSILPQKYFVERIVGNEYEVEVMVPPGQSPATYEPTPQQMVALSEAEMYFKIGVQFEKSWLSKIEELNPEMKIVDTAAGITLAEMESLEEILGEDPDLVEADHHHHDHEGAMDPHIWLSPELVKLQIHTIMKALSDKNPGNKEIYETNYDEFNHDLSILQKEIKDKLSNLKNRKILVFHPSWGYFSKEFNLQQIPIEVSGKAPTSKELTKIMQLAKDKKIKIIFVQKQFSKHEAEMIAENISGTVVQFDPLAENYLENMRFIATQINKFLGE